MISTFGSLIPCIITTRNYFALNYLSVMWRRQRRRWRFSFLIYEVEQSLPVDEGGKKFVKSSANLRSERDFRRKINDGTELVQRFNRELSHVMNSSIYLNWNRIRRSPCLLHGALNLTFGKFFSSSLSRNFYSTFICCHTLSSEEFSSFSLLLFGVFGECYSTPGI